MTMYGPVGIQGPYEPADAEEQALLRALGWYRISGEGPAAIWERPAEKIDGVLYPAERKPAMAILQDELGADSPYSNANTKPAATSGSSAIYYGPDGAAYRWNGKTDVRVPQFDNPTKAAGYQAPRAPSAPAAPTPPTSYIEEMTGDRVGVDPFTGAEVYRIKGAQWAAISPQEQRAIAQGDLATARAYSTSERIATQQYTSGENAANRSFQSGESAADRAFRAGESAADRAQRAAELAAQIESADRSLDVQVQTTNRGLQRQSEQDRLAAARQYADLVSSYDTAALPAYLAAGGGSVVNARQANPGGLLTDNAIRPAAQSLDQARNIRYDPITLQPRAPMTGALAAQTALRIPPQQSQLTLGTGENSAARWTPNGPVVYTPGQTPPAAAQPVVQDDGWQSDGAIDTADYSGGSAFSQEQAAANAGLTGEAADVYDAAFGPGGSWGVQGFAKGTRGGFIRAPRQFLGNELGPELFEVKDPPGANNAMLRVTPAHEVAGRGFARTPAYANGTLADPGGTGIPVAPDSATTPASSGSIQPMAVYNSAASPSSVLAAQGPSGDPYVDEVRAFRRGLQPLNVGATPYDPRFTRQVAPLLQQAYYMREQTREGVPADVIAWDAQRFRPRGFDRSAVRMRY